MGYEMVDMTTTTIYVPKALLRDMKIMATKRGKNVSEMIREWFVAETVKDSEKEI